MPDTIPGTLHVLPTFFPLPHILSCPTSKSQSHEIYYAYSKWVHSVNGAQQDAGPYAR